MNDQTQSDKFAAIAVSVLLILTAWTNAKAMLIISFFWLILFVLISKKSITPGGALTAAIAFLIAIGISLVILFS